MAVAVAGMVEVVGGMAVAAGAGEKAGAAVAGVARDGAVMAGVEEKAGEVMDGGAKDGTETGGSADCSSLCRSILPHTWSSPLLP